MPVVQTRPAAAAATVPSRPTPQQPEREPLVRPASPGDPAPGGLVDRAPCTGARPTDRVGHEHAAERERDAPATASRSGTSDHWVAQTQAVEQRPHRERDDRGVEDGVEDSSRAQGSLGCQGGRAPPRRHGPRSLVPRMAAMPTLTAVVLAWGDEPVLEESVARGPRLARTSRPTSCSSTTAAPPTRSTSSAARPASRSSSPGGTSVSPAAATSGRGTRAGEFLAFVNGDAVVRPEALARAGRRARRHRRARHRLAAALRRTRRRSTPPATRCTTSGSAGPAGSARPASEYAEPADVASATGAATACRADRFAALGGFCEPMFAYCEDTELSLRCWQRGWRVVYVPDAVVLHRYEFSRNPRKLYLVERNRLLFVLTVSRPALLALVALPMVAFELAVLALAVKDGWARQKVAGWWLAGPPRRPRPAPTPGGPGRAHRARLGARAAPHRRRRAGRARARRAAYTPTRFPWPTGRWSVAPSDRPTAHQLTRSRRVRPGDDPLGRRGRHPRAAGVRRRRRRRRAASTAAGSGRSGCSATARRPPAASATWSGPAGCGSSSTVTPSSRSASHVDERVLYDEETQFGDGEDRIAVVNAEGQPLGMDKAGRLQLTFETRTAARRRAAPRRGRGRCSGRSAGPASRRSPRTARCSAPCARASSSATTPTPTSAT